VHDLIITGGTLVDGTGAARSPNAAGRADAGRVSISACTI